MNQTISSRAAGSGEENTKKSTQKAPATCSSSFFMSSSPSSRFISLPPPQLVFLSLLLFLILHCCGKFDLQKQFFCSAARHRKDDVDDDVARQQYESSTSLSKGAEALELKDIIAEEAKKMNKQIDPKILSWKQILAFRKLKEKKSAVRREALLGTLLGAFAVFFGFMTYHSLKESDPNSEYKADNAVRMGVGGALGAGGLGSLMGSLAMFVKLGKDKPLLSKYQRIARETLE